MIAIYKQQGFTLIELLIVIAIGAVLATLAAPSFVDMTKNSRLSSAAREFQSIVQTARTEAITRNAIVSLYNPTVNGDWSGNIHLCLGAAACVSNAASFIKKFTIGDLSDDGASNGDITIDSNGTGDSLITVNASGQLITTTPPITIAFCDSRTEGNLDYQLLTISATGRPSVSDLGALSCVQ
jgi:prepilin-type N-terminal cleavage/methylation domain-containing protein